MNENLVHWFSMQFQSYLSRCSIVSFGKSTALMLCLLRQLSPLLSYLFFYDLLMQLRWRQVELRGHGKYITILTFNLNPYQ